ncbi:hypothetical protein WJX72_003074 [[Myrmecia] bisecta]|uniref:Large ribosomal subunit protein bL31c n=1 Tax=[Myrmecia] bisecta TaxID=41462 RepID=A0AAW1P7N2_9CHLO
MAAQLAGRVQLVAASSSQRCRTSSFQGAGVCSSRQSTLCGCQKGLQFHNGSRTVMLKKDIHPKYYTDAKVFCNGEEVLTVSGTKPEYTVDIWSGNHPFFQGATNTVVIDEGRVNRFNRRFSGLGSLGNVQTASGGKQPEFDKAAVKAAIAASTGGGKNAKGKKKK